MGPEDVKAAFSAGGIFSEKEVSLHLVAAVPSRIAVTTATKVKYNK